MRDVEFASTSEVDLAPFYGRLHIAYVPGTSGVVLGLSKVARLAKVLARRLTHQAALADAVLAAFVAAVRPRGAAVLVEAVAVGRPGAAAAPGGPGLVVTTAAYGCCADGLGGGPSVPEVLALLRLRGAAAGGTAPLPASASCGAAGGARVGAGRPAGPPPLPPLPAGAKGAAARTGSAGGKLANGHTAAPSPLTPGPATPDRGPGDAAVAAAADEEDDDPSRAYVHAGEVLWANGHGGVGAGRERRCCPGAEGGAGAIAAAPADGASAAPAPSSAPLPRPPSAAADLHLRGRGSGLDSSPSGGGGGTTSSPPPLGGGPAAGLQAAPSLEPCPARRAAVPAATRAGMVAAVASMLSLAGDDPARPGLRGSADRYVDGLLASTAGYDADLEGVIAGALAARAGDRCEAKDGRPGCGGAAAASASPFAATAAAAAAAAASPLLPPPAPSLLLSPPAVDVAVRFTSMCEHHMLPFHGVARVVSLVGDDDGSGLHDPSSSSSPPRPALDAATVAALVRAFALRLQVQERLTQQVTEAVHAAAGCPRRGTLVVIEAAHMCMVARGVEQHGSATVTVGARGELAGGGAARRELLTRLAGG